MGVRKQKTMLRTLAVAATVSALALAADNACVSGPEGKAQIAAIAVRQEMCPPSASFFGFMGCASALVFACLGAAYGTAKSGVGVANMGVLHADMVMKSIIPIIMAGVLGIYGLSLLCSSAPQLTTPHTAMLRSLATLPSLLDFAVAWPVSRPVLLLVSSVMLVSVPMLVSPSSSSVSS